MAVAAANNSNKTVADPCAAYESIKPVWLKNRAICGGERFVKEYDGILDVVGFSNLLIPFSPSMTQAQYSFYRTEAELPGLVGLYAKFVVGGLLRKQPHLQLPDGLSAEIKEWIMDAFTQDSLPLSAFLNEVLTEEVQTSRAWVYIDYPSIPNPDELTQADFLKYKPYPILWKAESIINWRIKQNPETGEQVLDRVIVRAYEESYEKNEFHPELVDVVYVHELSEGKYQIRKFVSKGSKANPLVVNGQIQRDFDKSGSGYELVETNQNILIAGERLNFIPAWPVNGSIEISDPFLSPLVDKEVNLYNKMSRRNHLLYGASTYTPVIISDMDDDAFQDIVNGGLGTWIHLRQGDQATVLETPTAALQDMDRAISASIEEMAKMGIRMLSPETAESGIALEIRNAAQTATLGTLNTKVSNTMADIIAFMIKWRFNIDITSKDVDFSLSADFNPSPLGSDWLRLCTEWYQTGLIPRSVWLQILKQNDIVPGDYNDEQAIQEVNSDEFIMPNTPGRMQVNAAIQGNAQRAAQEAAGMLDQVANQN